jgi:hypothetical protein
MTINLHGLVSTAGTIADNLIGLPTITHAAYVSVDGWGAATYATGVSRKCVIAHKQKRVIGKSGTEVISDTQITLCDSVVVNPLDKFTMPDGQTPPIVDVRYIEDKDGLPFATEIYF